MKKMLTIAASCAVLVCAPLVLAQTHRQWTYEGRTGATHWGELDKSYTTCSLGRLQSPINIETKNVVRAALAPIGFAYKTETAEVVNTGHSIQVNLPKGSVATINGVEYQLVQFHFHAPSEEKIDGRGQPMVVHLVHKNAEGGLAAIAVLLKEGRENEALKPIVANLPAKAGESKKLPAVDPGGLLPADQSYYAYIGSLTTPPCTEEVHWQVLETPVEISASQLAAIRKLYKNNARPLQPLNGRVVQVSQ